MTLYCVWPDDTVCEWDELEDYLLFMSDDFVTVSLPDNLDESHVPSYDALTREAVIVRKNALTMLEALAVPVLMLVIVIVAVAGGCTP